MATTAAERDPIAELGIKLISADNHINEPRDLFTTRFPKHLRDKAPRVIAGKHGGEGWAMDGSTPPWRTYGLEAMAGFDKSDYQVAGLSYSDLRRGNYDGVEHLKDMDIDGVYASVVHPGFSPSFYTHPDSEVALAGFQAYNDWVLDDFQAVDPRRLCGVAMTPMEVGIEQTVAEMRRVHAKGCRAIYIPGSPKVAYNHPTHYEPVWQTANDLGITLCMHRNHGGPIERTEWDFHSEDKVAIGGIVTRYFACVRPFSYLIFNGVFDRYPNLKLVGAQLDFSWTPFWVQTLDHHWDIQKSWYPVKLQRPPSDFIGKNIFTTHVDDRAGYKMIGTGLWPWLSGMTMFSSDYPHSVTLWPNSRAVLAEMIEGLQPDDARKALSENAARVFGFDV